MCPYSSRGTAASASSSSAALPPLALSETGSSESDSRRSSSDWFLKDGRKIQAGDCALFQAGSAPPFIGVIRWFTVGKEDYVRLCVNWLYRPVDIKLADGALLEAAPNEVFYSFHRDVISAASLLHPCKVTFLRKGIELPAGTSSFICRRVYDITNKCLWWLTDQDYVNERQEEVDQLLHKSKLEMHTTVQSGGRSPKPLNGPSSTQQSKSGVESIHNTGPSAPLQSKPKKRDRNDQGMEPSKRERSSRPDDGDCINFKSENMMKAEIVKITEKGGLVSSEGVEKLVNLIQLDRTEKKIDVTGRILVADVIATTDRYDCLCRFVQLKGVPILDDWLQEVQKCKSGDSSSPKETDKAIEELLLALLRALAKLPVNLNALQTCNIGKSVNHLRSHKNTEIQKKARGLIDTWKKRVDAEMTTKSVAPGQPVWHVKAGSSDASHAGNRRSGSNEMAVKSTVIHTAACKTVPNKSGPSDAIVKSNSGAQGSLKTGSSVATSTTLGSKDSLFKAASNVGSIDTPATTVKDEKSSSSSQSQNNSQSCSSDHAKTVGSSWKEETRSSSAGSINASKSAGSSSRHRRSTNGVMGSSISGGQKETHLGKSGSLNKCSTVEKSSQSGLTSEKPIDNHVVDHGNSHRLIVRLPNRVRSPARSASGGSLEDPLLSGSRVSSPGTTEKHEHSDRRVKLRVDGYQSDIARGANTEPWQSNNVKELVGAGSISLAADEVNIKSAGETGKGGETGKATETPRAACSSSGSEKGAFFTEPRTRNSFSSINALSETCVKYSEASAPVVEDVMGMNLLASVAVQETSKSDLVSPTGSPDVSPVTEDPSTETKSRLSSDDDDVAQSHVESDEAADADSRKKEKIIGSFLPSLSHQDGANFSGSKRTDLCFPDNNMTIEQAVPSPALSSHKTENSTKYELKHEEETDGNCSSAETEKPDSEGTCLVEETQFRDQHALEHQTDFKIKGSSLAPDYRHNEGTQKKSGDHDLLTSAIAHKDEYDLDIVAADSKSEKLVSQDPQSCTTERELPGGGTSSDQQKPQITDILERSADATSSLGTSEDTYRFCADESKTHKLGNTGVIQSNVLPENGSLNPSNFDESDRPAPASGIVAGAEESMTRENHESAIVGSPGQEPPSSFTGQDADHQSKPSGCEISGAVADMREDLASSAEALPSSVTAGPDVTGKLDFDLNEGIPADDGNQVESAASISNGCAATIHLSSLSPFANSVSDGLPAPITIAAPAKGPFVPPENLRKGKGEPGWKGSAATSAFRPAEPRKVMEMPSNAHDMPLSDSAVKHCRPLLDIDLNEPDDRVLEELATQSSITCRGSDLGTASNADASERSFGGLDLDLNRIDEGAENGQFVASTSGIMEVPLLPVGPASIQLPNREVNMARDFDLNNGPGVEVCSEPVNRSQNAKGTTSMAFLPPIAGVKMNATELGSVSSWFPPGSSYPAVAIPSFFTNRREQPYPIVAPAGSQRILGPVTTSVPFGGDVFRGPVLSSSPSMTFTPTAFPYASYSFGSNFAIASTSYSGGPATFVDSSPGAGAVFPTMPLPLVGPAGAILSSYPRPYPLSLPESGATAGSDNTRKWISSGLDLNAGPGSADIEGKDERLSLASRQLLVSTSQPYMEEQVRMYATPGGGSKRKEPEGGGDAGRSAYKQLSW